MKFAVATLAMFTTGMLSLACADPPPNPEDTTGQDSATHAVPATPPDTATKAPALVPAKPPPSTSGERRQEELLRNQGYKLIMVRGEAKYCRREIPVGSHLATVMHCVTIAEAQAMEREARETAERIQRNSTGCLSRAQGACGN